MFRTRIICDTIYFIGSLQGQFHILGGKFMIYDRAHYVTVYLNTVQLLYEDNSSCIRSENSWFVQNMATHCTLIVREIVV